MTIEETIKVLSHEQACVMRQTGPGCDRNCAACDLVLPDELVISAYRTTVNILRAQQEAEKNEPLTATELRKMVGNWVWVVVKYKRGTCKGWAFIATPLCVGFLEHVIPIDDCGKRFEAYRRPPKEVTGRWRQREMEAPNG